MALDEEEQQAYKTYMENEQYHNSMIWSSHEEGRQEGIKGDTSAPNWYENREHHAIQRATALNTLTEKALLMLIDLQQAIDHPSWGQRNNPDAEDKISFLLETWRRRELPILHVKHMSTRYE